MQTETQPRLTVVPIYWREAKAFIEWRYLDDPCTECGRGWTPTEWDDRHTAPDGSDIHAECCTCEGAA